MASQQAKLYIPSHDDILRYIGYVTAVLPPPIVALSIMTIFSIKTAHFLPKAVLFIMTVYHGCKLYLSINSIGYSSDPAYKRIWLNNELHILIFIFSVHILNSPSVIAYLIILILETAESAETFRDNLAPRLDEMKDSVISACNAFLDFGYIFRVQAVIEIIYMPYLFFLALFTFNSETWSSFLFYTVGYLAFQLLNSKHHDWIWSTCGKYLQKLANNNKDTFGKYIDQLLNEFRKIPEMVRIIYPINKFTEFVKKHS